MGSSSKVVLIGLDGANPGLLQEYVSRGALPNFAALMERGAFAFAMPSVPANTPVNWTGIATGAHPGTHGVTDYVVHLPGQRVDGVQDAFHSGLVSAEQIWHTADREGRRAIVMNYPCAYPASMTHGIFVGGEGRPGAGSIFELKTACCFASTKSGEDATNATTVKFNDVDGSPQTTISLVPDKGVQSQGVEYDVRLVASRGTALDTAEIRLGKSRRVCLGAREWSHWLADRFSVDGKAKKGWFKFHLSELSRDGERFKLYTTQIFPESGYTAPDGVGKELVETIGPYLEYCTTGPWRRHWHSTAAAFDEMREKGTWLAEAGSYLMREYEGDLLYSHFHIFDHVFHYLWGASDPVSPWYDLGTSNESEAWILEAHKIADEMLGVFLDGAAGDTTFIVVSDHGLIPTIKAVSINNLLAQEGLISCQPGPNNRPVVDWAETRAYKANDAVHIWINLKGREAGGIVDEAEYEHLQEKILDILLGLRDPENGKHPVALALKRSDAALLGLWGERVGDIVFLMNSEYTASRSSPLTNDGRVIVKMGPQELPRQNFPMPKFQAYHGCTLPTTRLGRGGSEAGMFLISGPNIRRGIRREKPIELIDVAPTAAHLMGMPQPAHAEGRVLRDILI